MTPDPVYYLTVEDLHVIAGDVVTKYLVRDHGLLASAVARPQTTVFGNDAYPTLLDKSAALLQSIAGNHPLIDGNKRLAITAAVVFLARNGISTDHLDEDLAYDLMMSVASGAIDEVPDIAERLAEVLAYNDNHSARAEQAVQRLRGTTDSVDIENMSTGEIMNITHGE